MKKSLLSFCASSRPPSRRGLLKVLVVLAVVLLLLLLYVSAHAADSPGSSFIPADPGISGDFCYDLRAHQSGYGPSYTLGTFGPDQVVEIKAAWVIFPTNGTVNKLGVGLAVNLPKLLKAAGVQDVPDWFNTSVGVLVLLNLQDEPELSPGIYCTLLRIEF